MRLKKPLVTVTLSFADQKRVAMFYQILMSVDKRIARSQPEQKKAKSKQKYEKIVRKGAPIGSPKKRACLFVAAIMDDMYSKRTLSKYGLLSHP